MKPLSDKDLLDYLQCPAMWYARLKGKFKPYSELAMEYFRLYVNNDESFAQWQVDNSKALFYSGGGLKNEFKQISSCAERLMIDPLVSIYQQESESFKIETTVYDVPFKFTLHGVDLETLSILIFALGPNRLSSKKPFYGNSGNPQWLNWIIADQYPALAWLYTEAIKNQFCIECKPLLAVVEKNYLPDYNLYDCKEVSRKEASKVEWAISSMESILLGDSPSSTLTSCGFCEYCRTTKELTEPEILTFLT